MLLWLLVFAACLEIASFGVITVLNIVLYDNAREGTKAVYDPYALFLQANGIWPTMGIATSGSIENDRVVWFFGGSTMRASTAPFDKSIPSFVASELNAAPGPVRYNCFNFGINSFNSILETKYLQKQLIEFQVRPNLVVFYDGANDANYFALYKSPYGHEGMDRVQGLLESYFKTPVGILKPLCAAWYASFTRELLAKAAYALTPLDPDAPMLRDYIELTVKRYDHVDRMAAAYGASFLLFLQPVYWAETCGDLDPAVRLDEERTILGRRAFPHVRQNFMIVYAALEQALADRPYFVSLRNALCSRTAPAYTADGVHQTDAGREGVARVIVPLLRQRLERVSSKAEELCRK
ncbi:SGNH/GDSL hydrolase family protein [Desulfolutivibrio sulfoxidireducens]|uniref:SGNH/GDSL hydrolase family protein n=1 Tax=Desulfolutivibrio sulfoxidireducens TaxID=2773299 RepID=UPI00159DBA38|nr:SGNH/GDSL hydrolase family protein [Desulfolutivibrio sulfoxidireducens]QLA18316.1 SGNH/GDSL hydrolase family protein [Desulfolutivibrio sulfoxidireducens]